MNNINILYIEDDIALGRLIQNKFRKVNYQVDIANTGEQGLEKLSEQHYALVIIDYHLPVMNGLDVIKTLQSQKNGTPIIMLSGSDNLHIAVEAIRLGASDYVLKQVDSSYLELLMTTIKKTLEKQELKREKLFAEKALQENLAILEMILSTIDEGLSYFDKDLNLVNWNEKYFQLFDYPLRLAKVGTPFEEFIKIDIAREELPNKPFAEILATCFQVLQKKTTLIQEYQRCNDIVLEIRRKRTLEGGVVSSYTDITNRKKAEQYIEYQAFHDALTGLPNRSYFFKQLKKIFTEAQAGQKEFSLIFIDLDGFKQVNDTLGHKAGDELLIHVAERLKACVRKGDIVSRLGGDEFTIIFPQLNKPIVEKVAQRIIFSIAKPFFLKSISAPAKISSSIGIAIYPYDGANSEILLKNADDAMYAAKAAGRNTYIFVDSITK